MKKIKQYFIDFRSSTPKRIQWLLLGAAFVVVIVLIVLLFTMGGDDNEKIESADEVISFSVTPERVDLTGTVVGDSKNQNLNITVSTPVVFDGIIIDANDITTMNNCDNLTSTCLINVIYKPTKAMGVSETTLKITWHELSQKDIVKTYEVPVVYGAEKAPEPVIDIEPEPIAPAPVVEPEKPVVEPTPVVEPEPIFDVPEILFDDEDDDVVDEEYDTDDYPEPEPVPNTPSVSNQISDEIRAISKPDIFKEVEPVPEFSLPPERCSDFAIPGYDQSGLQIGWIKPESGANYFHPFSDVDCSKPTGRYDFATGVITSLKDGSKIGTDANHIGYRNVRGMGLSVPKLSEPMSMSLAQNDGTFGPDAKWATSEYGNDETGMARGSQSEDWVKNEADQKKYRGSSADAEFVLSSRPYDRTFILRQFKPIPATIVSEVRADPSVYGCSSVGSGKCEPDENHSIPVRATVDRNVFSDDGRTIIIPTGTLLMGYLSGDLPGPYQSIGRMNIKWYQFIRPDGVEFNFKNADQDPYSADAQGRVGVPGHGSTDYIEQMVMPILTSLVPAAVNMIAPIADTVINQIDLDNNTIVQSGTVRSSEMAKQEIISTWNKVAQKLLVDVMANTVPPFSIAAGTRINVYSPVDLAVTCGDDQNKKCFIAAYDDNVKRRKWSDLKKEISIDKNDPSWVGQVRSFDLQKYCKYDESKKKWLIDTTQNWMDTGYEYRTVYAYCESLNYEAVNNAKQKALYENQQQTFQKTTGGTTYVAGKTPESSTLSLTDQKTYNENVLGLTYNEDGTIENPFAKKSAVPEVAPVDDVVTCDDGGAPDANGCCAGETYTDMGDAGFNCCPDSGGDCFPPIIVE